MTSKRANTAQKKPRNMNAHLRAMEKPTVKRLVRILDQRWALFGNLERGKRLGALIVLGCSARGLEKEVGQSATTIRRNIALSKLPEDDRNAIQGGASAKRILEVKANIEEQKWRLDRIVLDQETNTLSDAIATMILKFCRAEVGGPLTNPVVGESATQLMNELLWILRRYETAGQPRTIRMSKKKSMKVLLKMTKPPDGEEETVASQFEWIARVVWEYAPARQTWEAAVAKAKKRMNELKPPFKTPGLLFMERIQHSNELWKSPLRRKKFIGAIQLKRQGRPDASKTIRKLTS
jgi:hypothetical protein